MSSLITYGITLIILSLIAVPSLILSKRPDAKELLDKVAPYQGWIGVVFCFWGIWGIIHTLLNIDMLAFPHIYVKLSWITALAYAVVETVLGFMLGYSLIVKYVLSKNEAAKEKGAQVLAKLAPMQGTFGIIGICVGVWCIILYFLVRVAITV